MLTSWSRTGYRHAFTRPARTPRRTTSYKIGIPAFSSARAVGSWPEAYLARCSSILVNTETSSPPRTGLWAES